MSRSHRPRHSPDRGMFRAKAHETVFALRQWSVDVPKRSPQPSQPVSTPAEHPRALGALRLSYLTEVTTSPGRQRTTIRLCAQRLGLTLIAEASDLEVSARTMSPFERPSLSAWLRRPEEYEAIVWSHVDRAARSVAHMSELIEWSRQRSKTLIFGMPEERQPLVITPHADSDAIRHCMRPAYAAEQETRAVSARLTSAHEVLRATGRYGGGLVPFGYKKAPHPSGTGWCLAPDPETVTVVRAIVDHVHSGLSLVAIAHKLETAGVMVPRDRHAHLQGRPTGGRRHGRDFERFRWTAGSLCKILRTPALMGHRVHKGATVRDAEGSPVLIGPPLLTEEEFQALQATLNARSNGTHPKGRETSLLIGVAHCTGCAVAACTSPLGRRMRTATTSAALLPAARRAPLPLLSAPAGSTSTPSTATTRLSPRTVR